MKTVLLFIALTLLLFSCKKDDPPTACFNHDPDTNIFVGDTIRFTNCSSDADEYYWDFGDTSISVEKEPYHVYEKPGSYTIKMIASSDSQSDTMAIQILIHSNNTEACFSFAPDTNIFAGDTVYFTNCTSGQGSYTWDFGDNQTSSEKNPYHVYSNPGNYTIELRVQVQEKSYLLSKNVNILPVNISYDELLIDKNSNTNEIVAVNQVAYSSTIDLDLDRDSSMDITFRAYGFYSHGLWTSFTNFHFISNKFMVDCDSVYCKYATYSMTFNGHVYNFHETYDPNQEYPSDVVIDSILKVYPAVHQQGDALNKNKNWQNIYGLLAYDTYDEIDGVLNTIYEGLWRGNTGFLGIRMQDGDRTRYGWIELKVTLICDEATIDIYNYYLQK